MWAYLNEATNLSGGVRRFIASEALLGIAIGLYALVFNLHLLDIGFDEAGIGRITSMGTLIIGIFSIPIGLLINYFGRKKLLVSGLTLMGFGYLGIGIGQETITFYISQIIASIGISMLITSEIQLLFYYSRSKKEETKAFSMLFAIFTFFTGIGTLLGGFLPNLLGGKTTVYQSTVIIAALLVLTAALVRGVLLPTEKSSHIDRKASLSLVEIKRQLKNKKIWLFAFFTFLIGASYAIVVPYFNIVLKFRFSLNDELISLLLTINGLFLFLGSFFMPYFLERWGDKKTYFILYITTITVSLILFFNVPIGVFSILLFTRGGSFTMLNNMIDSQTMQAIADEDRNIFAGLRVVFRSTGSAIANLSAGIILNYKNYSLPFLISGLLLLLSFIFYYTVISSQFEEIKNDNHETEISI